MDKRRTDLHLVGCDETLLDALSRLNALPSGEAMALVATWPDGRVAGTVTDGDLRRALLDGQPLTAPVSIAMHTGFRHVTEGEDAVERIRAMRLNGLRLIPVTDAEGRLTDIIDTAETPGRLPISAILMAGGKGERLRPLTLTVPKPLLAVGDRAIIDHNITALRRAGVQRIYVTVNYLGHLLESHFEGTEVVAVRESEPMGTIGSAALCPLPADGVTLIMNADLLTTISFEEFYLHHKETGAAITIAAIPYNVSVPYAILTTQADEVKGLEEKPSYSYYANAGIYLMDNALLRTLPATGRTDATDFVEQAIADGRKVSFFPISGTWIDIGSPADYARACQLMKHIALSNPS